VFTEQDLDKVLNKGVITKTVGEKLLNLYLGDVEGSWWDDYVVSLFIRLKKKHGEEEAKKLIREAVSFAILLPAFDRSAKIDKSHPENLLFWGMSYHQFNQRDWFDELKKVIERDQQIAEWRREVLQLGVIDAIDFQPFCRQAYKWLCGWAEDSGVELTPELEKKFRQLVLAYGGAVVSNVFEKHTDKVKKIVNWRSGYFFERIIFNVYSLDQIKKIKRHEIEKTNPQWIKAIR